MTNSLAPGLRHVGSEMELLFLFRFPILLRLIPVVSIQEMVRVLLNLGELFGPFSELELGTWIWHNHKKVHFFACLPNYRNIQKREKSAVFYVSPLSSFSVGFLTKDRCLWKLGDFCWSTCCLLRWFGLGLVWKKEWKTHLKDFYSSVKWILWEKFRLFKNFVNESGFWKFIFRNVSDSNNLLF